MRPDYSQDIENLVSIYDSTEEKDKLNLLLEEIKSEESFLTNYISNCERYFKKRFGIRPSIVTWPWRNASNLHLPLTDKTIRRAKPNFANLISGIYPTVSFESNILGDDPLLVRGIERWFHHLLHDEDKMSVDLALFWGIDLMLERGRFIVKVIQEFTPQIKHEVLDVRKLSPEMISFMTAPETTDDMLAMELALQYDMDLDNERDLEQIKSVVNKFRSGDDVIEFSRQVNLTPFPSLYVRDPLTVLFPSDTMYIISKARWIRDRVTLTLDDIEVRLEEGIWDKANTRELLSKLGRYDNYTPRYHSQDSSRNIQGPIQLEKIREGVSGSSSNGMVIIDEIYFWKKLPGERLPRRMVLTIHPDHPDLPLRLISYPYEKANGEPEDWPFDQVQYEIVSDRALSPRGYPQLLDSLQTELINNHNAKQNWMTIANSLNIKAKRNSNISTQWIPGQPIWVNRMDDIQEINIAQRDLSFDNEERILKSWAEEYIGVILDPVITNQTGLPERRTKAEIELVAALQAQVASLDGRIFQACMQRVYNRIWNRVMQYGPDFLEFDGANGQITRVHKSEIKTRFRLSPTGTIFNSNRQLQALRYKDILATIGTLPFVDTFELTKTWLTYEDERLAQSVLIEPEFARQNQVERFISDVMRIKEGYLVIPRPDDDNRLALAVIDDYLGDPIKRRNFPTDRLEALVNFRKAHELALIKKSQQTTRGGRIQQEVANTAQGLEGREARLPSLAQ